MPEFVLSQAVEELKYNFAPYGGADKIPEPSADQITAFRIAVAEGFTSLIPDNMDPQKLVAETPTVEMVKQVTSLIGEGMSEIQEKILHHVSEVCSNKPSFDELQALPYRQQQAFVGWITGMFLLPPALATVTNA